MREVIFLLAQGAQTRMQALLDSPKQLLTLQGVPILIRTIALLREIRPHAKIVAVIPKDPVWAEVARKVDATFTQHNPGYYQMDILRNTRSQWGTERTTFLHGDAMFSPEALRTMVEPSEARFDFCVRGAWNIISGNGRKEVYGFAIAAEGYEAIDEILAQPQVSPCFNVKLVWDLVAQLQETQLAHTKLHRLGSEDYTDDLDMPDDLRGLDFVEEFLNRQQAIAKWKEMLSL